MESRAMGDAVGQAVAKLLLITLLGGAVVGGGCVLLFTHCPVKVKVERAK